MRASILSLWGLLAAGSAIAAPADPSSSSFIQTDPPIDTEHLQLDISSGEKTVVEVRDNGEVRIDWAGVEALAALPDAPDVNMIRQVAQLLLAVRDKTYKPLN